MATAQEWFLNPWGKMSAQHRPIGTGAVYRRENIIGLLTDSNDWTFNTGNGNRFGHVTGFANLSDPVRTVTHNGILSGRGLPISGLHISDAFPEPVSQEATSLMGANPDNRYTIFQFYGLSRTNPRTAAILWQLDARGLGHGTTINQRVGTSAYLGSALVGCVRKHEIETPGMAIRHVIHLALPSWAKNTGPSAPQPLGKGVRRPAMGGDGTGHNNTGPIDYGDVLAIRPQDEATCAGLINSTPVSSFAGSTARADRAKEIAIRLLASFVRWGLPVFDEGDRVAFRCDLPFTPLPGGGVAQLSVDLRTLMLRFMPQYLYVISNSVTFSGTPAVLVSGGRAEGDVGAFQFHNGLPVTGGGTPLATNNALDNDGSAPEPPPPPSEAAMPTGLISAAFGLEASGDPPPPETLSEPAQLSFNYQASSPTSVVSSTINPGAGALVRVIVRHAAATQRAHTPPTTTLANMHDFGEGARFEKVWDSAISGASERRVTEWWGYSTGATGEGTITGNMDGAVANASIEVLRFAAGWAAAPNGLFDTTEGSANTWAVEFGSAPVGTSQLVMAMLQAIDTNVATLPSGWTEITNFVSSFHHAVTAYAPGSVGAGPHTITDLSGVIKAGGALETLQA